MQQTPLRQLPIFVPPADDRVRRLPLYQFELPVTQADLDAAPPEANPIVAALRREGARGATYQSRVVRFDLDGAVPWRDVAARLGWQGVFAAVGLVGLLNGRWLTVGIRSISWSGVIDEPTYESLLAWTRGHAATPFVARFQAQALEINR